jgi:trigger factor
MLLFTGCASTYTFNWDTEDLSKYVTVGKTEGFTLTADDVAEITDEDVMANAQSIADGLAEQTDLTAEDALKDGDSAYINYVGTKDGVEFDGGKSETETGTELVLGSDSFIDGFEDGLIGKHIGEHVTLNLTFPEDYNSEELAGQDVVFEVDIISAKGNVPPVIDDAFIAENFTEEGYTTLQQYMDEERAHQEEHRQITLTSNKYKVLWQAIIDDATVISIPQGLIDDYVKKQTARDEAVAASPSQGESRERMNLSQYIKEVLNTTREAYNEGLVTKANNLYKEMFVLKSLLKTGDYNLTDEEYQAKFDTWLDTQIESISAYASYAGYEGEVTDYTTLIEAMETIGFDTSVYSEENLRESFTWEKMMETLSAGSSITMVLPATDSE